MKKPTAAALPATQTLLSGLAGFCEEERNDSMSAGEWRRRRKKTGMNDVARNHRRVHALSAVALEGDEGISEDLIDKVVHCRLFKLAALSGLALKGRRATDRLGKELIDAGEGRRAKLVTYRRTALKDREQLTLEEGTKEEKARVRRVSIRRCETRTH